MRWIWVVLVVLSLGACARQEPKEPPQPAPQQQTSSLRVAFSTLMSSTRDIGVRTGEDVLLKWKDEAKLLETKLADLPERSELDQQELEVVRAFVSRIDAALAVKSIQAQVEAAVKKATGRASLDRAAMDRERSRLRESDTTFKALDDRLAVADRRYTDATNQLAQAMEAHARLVATSKG
ncbi:MAG: hypothetical protein K8H99_10685 [Nitrospirae bacterium]|nr:hypothetical protein [Fimbriimonadaceae bacterium]